MKVYECVIVGGGPAGLSAAIYLGRFNRYVIVVDNEEGRSSFSQHNENYLGFPEGIDARELRRRGKLQAQRYGVEFQNDEIIRIIKHDHMFTLKGKYRSYESKTVILATGVTDLFPHFDMWKKYVGKSMFWCITCDGYKMTDKKIVIIGSSNEAACTCMQFLNFTKDIVFVTNIDQGKEQISRKWKIRFREAGIPFYPRCIRKINGNDGFVKEVILDNGLHIQAEFIINEQGSIPCYELAQQIQVKLNKDYYIMVSHEQRTSIEGVYAAGDVTDRFSHQVVTAAHEGSMAAQAVNYDLYAPFQKE